MFSISNHYGRKCISILLQLEPCSDMSKFISDVLAHWYEMINTIMLSLQLISAIQ